MDLRRAAREPAPDIIITDAVDALVARVITPQVVDEDEPARAGDSEEFLRDAVGNIFVGDATEQREREREIEQFVWFRDGDGAALMHADVGGVTATVGDRGVIQVLTGLVFWTGAPLHHQAEVVSGGTARLERFHAVEVVQIVSDEDATEQPLTFLHHQQVARFED